MAGKRLRIAIWGLAAALWLLPLVAGTDPRGAALSLCFVLPWLLSAGLFRHAALAQARSSRIASS